MTDELAVRDIVDKVGYGHQGYLFQTEWWETREMEMLRIATDMTPTHAANTYRYMLRNGSAVAKRAWMQHLASIRLLPQVTRQDVYALNNEITRVFSDENWFEKLPLMQALKARAHSDATVEGTAEEQYDIAALDEAQEGTLNE